MCNVNIKYYNNNYYYYYYCSHSMTGSQRFVYTLLWKRKLPKRRVSWQEWKKIASEFAASESVVSFGFSVETVSSSIYRGEIWQPKQKAQKPPLQQGKEVRISQQETSTSWSHSMPNMTTSCEMGQILGPHLTTKVNICGVLCSNSLSFVSAQDILTVKLYSERNL